MASTCEMTASQSKKSLIFFLKRFLVYFSIGLLVDSLLAIFFLLFDTLDILNQSFVNIFELNPFLIPRIIGLYFFTFTLIGVLFTLFLFFIYFLYKKERRIKQFIWTKVDLLLIVWFLLLYSILLDFYIKEIFNIQLKGHEKLLIFSGIMYLLLSLASLYFNRRVVKFPLYFFRSFCIFIVVSVFLSLTITNISFFLPATAGQPDTFQVFDRQDIKNLNVLLITLDTCRADKLSVYGFDKVTSPNIDELASHSFAFDYAFSASNWTKPATASLITSVYPGTHQTNALAQKIPARILCLPERFKKAGYHTGLFSANPQISPDFGFDQGVDFFYETAKLNMIHFSTLFMRLSMLSPRLAHKLKLQRLKDRQMISNNISEEEAIYTSFMQWLERIRNEKFFAILHFNTPHAAYDPPPEYDVFAEDPTVHVWRQQPKLHTRLPGDKLDRLLSLYYGEIFYVDSVIGKIIEEFKKAGLFDKTIIVITSDHGEEFYDHKAWGHSHSLFNELLHIPLIFYIPNYPYSPIRIKNYVSLIDIGPTLLSLVGLPGDPFMEGKDLSPLFQGDDNDVHDFIYIESLASPKSSVSKYAIIRNGFKYIVYDSMFNKSEVLYDLNEDFKEQKILPKHSIQSFAELKEQVTAMKKHVISKKIDSQKIKLSAEKKEQLKALGYLN